MKQKKKSSVYIRTYGKDMMSGEIFEIIDNMEITRQEIQKRIKILLKMLESPQENFLNRLDIHNLINDLINNKEDLRGLNELLGIPFDLLIVVDKEER